MINEHRKSEQEKPRCIGTGLIALDLVISSDPTVPIHRWTGGSCGNVISILAYLGWDAYPVARLGNDRIAGEIIADLSRWNVKTNFISLAPSGSTPLIVERILSEPGRTPRHKYEFTCPSCGSYLPRFRPVSEGDAVAMTSSMPSAQVFYFDRVSRSSIHFARESKLRGALVVFEPSSTGDRELFVEAVRIADIIKYSRERFPNIEELSNQTHSSLEIQTLGSEGLLYRCPSRSTAEGNWIRKDAYTVEGIRDSAGAGDWCTAGIIDFLGRGGRRGFDEADERRLWSAIDFGQRLASLSCLFEGARGAMYSLSNEEFEQLLAQLSNASTVRFHEIPKAPRIVDLITPICLQCPLPPARMPI